MRMLEVARGEPAIAHKERTVIDLLDLVAVVEPFFDLRLAEIDLPFLCPEVVGNVGTFVSLIAIDQFGEPLVLVPGGIGSIPDSFRVQGCVVPVDVDMFGLQPQFFVTDTPFPEEKHGLAGK